MKRALHVATFADKLRAVMARGIPLERARRIVGAMVRDERKRKR